MGQTPSCMPASAADTMRKHVNAGRPASDGPTTQSMTRRPPSSSFSHHTSPTLQRQSPSSFTFQPSSPPSPLSLHKTLTIDPDLSSHTPSGFSPSSNSAPSSSSSSSSPHTSHSSSVLSLLSRLSTKRDTRQWVASTPTGADALRFRHFCPICYRHHARVLVTSCCSHNICGECADAYLAAKLPAYLPLAFLPSALDVLPCACPHCNQQSGVRFVPLTDKVSARSYVESPRTAALIKQRQQQTQHMQPSESSAVAEYGW